MRRFVIFAVLAGVLFSQSSLVELSRKEKERRKKIKQTRVITNEDLKKGAGVINVIGTSSSVVSTKPPQETSAEGKSKKREKAWWAEQSKTLKERIKKLENKIKELELKVNSLSTQFLIEQRPFEHARVKSELERAKGELIRARNELKAAEKELEALYDKARKEGIPPGWVR